LEIYINYVHPELVEGGINSKKIKAESKKMKLEFLESYE